MSSANNVQNFIASRNNEPQRKDNSGTVPTQGIANRRQYAQGAYVNIRNNTISQATAAPYSQQHTASPTAGIAPGRYTVARDVQQNEFESQGDQFDATTLISDSDNTTANPFDSQDRDDTLNIDHVHHQPSIDDDENDVYRHARLSKQHINVDSMREDTIQRQQRQESVGQRYKLASSRSRDAHTPSHEMMAEQLMHFANSRASSIGSSDDQRIKESSHDHGQKSRRDNRFHSNVNLRRDAAHGFSVDNRPKIAFNAARISQDELRRGEMPQSFRQPDVLQDSGSFLNPGHENESINVSGEHEEHTNGEQHQAEQDLFQPSDAELGSDNETSTLAHHNPYPTVKQPKPLPSVQSRKKKRPTVHLDYAKEALYKMDYEELKNEPFDHKAKAPNASIPADLAGPIKSLEERLQSFRGKTEEEQRQWFQQMSLTEWEMSGEWFVGRFGEVMNKFVEARKEKRAISERFEKELAEREEAVRRKREEVKKVMQDMRTGGEGVLRGKTPS